MEKPKVFSAKDFALASWNSYVYVCGQRDVLLSSLYSDAAKKGHGARVRAYVHAATRAYK